MGGLGDIFQKISLAGVKLRLAIGGLAGKAIDKTGDFASTKLLAWSRSPLNAILGRFFGDVFIYLNSRGTRSKPGPIPKRILAEFDDAHRQTPAGEPFVIIGHSLGAVIAMDLLSYYRPDLEVDLFVSVGSQVAHFEELKLYKNSDKAVVAPQRVPRPANIHRWINVYDEVDIFAYAVERIYEGVDLDSRYDTETFTVKAHVTYFTQDRFYQRLRARIDGLS
jgi:pimeloyl-ACP methyl ester carboxylesterase